MDFFSYSQDYSKINIVDTSQLDEFTCFKVDRFKYTKKRYKELLVYFNLPNHLVSLKRAPMFI